MWIRDLPDMYALSPWALAIHIRQITHAHVITITYNYIPYLALPCVCLEMYRKLY